MRGSRTGVAKILGILLFGMIVITALPDTARGQGESHNDGSVAADHANDHRARIVSFSVELPDDTLTYPSYLVNIPDEHTTLLPLFNWLHPWQESNHSYLLFGSSKTSKTGPGGAVVLETTDLVTFTAATDKGYAEQVMVPPVLFTSCDPAFDTEFDENYSAPGSVVQDPTLPPGNLIMIYEAENHCPGGTNQQPYYATVGFARSLDNGKTWPPPANGPLGNATRHPVLKGPVSEPTKNTSAPLGDAIPSAFVDGEFIYVAYAYHAPGLSGNLIRVARASLRGGDHGFDGYEHSGASDSDDAPIQFYKWNNGAFSEPGIGGVDTAVLPDTGCLGTRMMPSISYNDDLRLYMMIFVCNTDSEDGTASWFYATATSLERQDWSVPELILNSQQYVTSPCNLNATPPTGSSFDGFYPSFMSPNAAAGHLKLSGIAFLQNGCDTGARVFASRKFTIAVQK
jgi:hypothetical protein